MKRLSSMALVLVMVAGTVGVPNYVIAAGCDPASGCCSTGQTYVGRQLFPNPAAPYQLSPGAAASPRPITNATNAVSNVTKPPVAQRRIVPGAAPAPQAVAHVQDILTFSCTPCLGTLW